MNRRLDSYDNRIYWEHYCADCDVEVWIFIRRPLTEQEQI